MRFYLLLTLLLVSISVNISFAGAATKIRRQVLLPDGQPAAQAKLWLRSFVAVERNATGKGIRQGRVRYFERTVRVDEQGFFEVELNEEEAAREPFLLIDAPDCALALSPVFDVPSCIRMPGTPLTPIRLTKDFQIRGRVIDDKGKAASGVSVLMASPALNWLDTGVSTPQLVTASAADGSFALRGITGIDKFSHDFWHVYALRREGERLTAIGFRAIRIKIDKSPPRGDKTTDATTSVSYPAPLIVLRPTIGVRGRVLNEVSRQPVAGATVTLETIESSYISLHPVKTGQDGRFDFHDVPLWPSNWYEAQPKNENSYPLNLHVTHPDLPMVQMYLHYFSAFEKIPPFYDVTMRMRPLATISGQVIDVATGKPPLWPPELVGFRQEIGVTGHSQSGSSRPVQLAKDTGRFSMRLATGQNYVGLSGPGFYKIEQVIAAGHNILGQDVIYLPPAGLRDVIIKARKVPCFWIHLDTDDTQTNSGGQTFTLQTRAKINSQTEHYLRREWNFLPAEKWGQEIEVRVLRKPSTMMGETQEILPWTKIRADSLRTPIVIRIPTKTAEAATIGYNLPLRFSKYNFK